MTYDTQLLAPAAAAAVAVTTTAALRRRNLTHKSAKICLVCNQCLCAAPYAPLCVCRCTIIALLSYLGGCAGGVGVVCLLLLPSCHDNGDSTGLTLDIPLGWVCWCRRRTSTTRGSIQNNNRLRLCKKIRFFLGRSRRNACPRPGSPPPPNPL